MSLLPPVVAELTANISEFSSRMDEAQLKMGETAAEGETSMGGLASFGKTALLALGAAAVGVGAMAIDLGTKWQTSTNSLAASAGISVKAANGIGNAFLGTAFNTTFSAQQIMKAYQPVAGQLAQVEGHALNAKQAMAIMSQAMDLAEGSGMSLTSATSDLSQVMQTYGLHANSAAQISNVLFSTSRLTGQGVDSVTQAFTRLRAGLGAATPSLGQVGGLLVDLQAHGETGRKGISAATTALTSLLTATEGVSKAQMDQKAVYQQMSPVLQALVNRYQSGALTYAEFYKQSQQLGQSQLDLVTQWNSAGTAIQAAQTKLDAMGITVDNAQGKFVGMGSVITQLHAKIQGETQAQQLATLAQVFGTGAATKMLSVVEAGPAAYDKATSAVLKTGAAHNAAAKNAATLKGEMEKLDHGFEDVVTQIGTRLVPIMTTMVGWVTKLFTVTGPTKDVLLALGVVVGGVVLTAMGAFIASLISSQIEMMATGNSATFNALMIMTRWAGVAASAVASAAVQVAAWASTAAAAVLAQAAFLLPILPFILLGAAAVAAVALIVTHFTQVREFIGGVVGDIVGFFAALPGRVLGFVGGLVTSVINFFTGLPGRVMATLASWASDWLTLGEHLVQGLISGIMGGIGKAINAVKSLGSGIIGAAKSILGIFSPSTVFAEMGGHIGGGLALGIAGSQATVARATTGLMSTVTSAAGGIGAGGVGAGAGGGLAGRPIQITYNIPVTGDMSPQTVLFLRQQFKQHDAELERQLEAMR